MFVLSLPNIPNELSCDSLHQTQQEILELVSLS